MLLRCTGTVLRLDPNEGISTRTQKAYRIPRATVLVEDQGVAEVNIPDILEARLSKGEAVDWLVEVEVRGGFLSARFVSDLAPLSLAPSYVSPGVADISDAG
jgi:hypothetical protein